MKFPDFDLNKLHHPAHVRERPLRPCREERRMRVLQVKDDAKTAQTVAMILKSDGHDCDTANCGKRALELARHAEYDIILLDIGLPDIDGHEVLQSLREAGVMAPVVIQPGLVLRKNEVS